MNELRYFSLLEVYVKQSFACHIANIVDISFQILYSFGFDDSRSFR